MLKPKAIKIYLHVIEFLIFSGKPIKFFSYPRISPSRGVDKQDRGKNDQLDEQNSLSLPAEYSRGMGSRQSKTLLL